MAPDEVFPLTYSALVSLYLAAGAVIWVAVAVFAHETNKTLPPIWQILTFPVDLAVDLNNLGWDIYVFWYLRGHSIYEAIGGDPLTDIRVYIINSTSASTSMKYVKERGFQFSFVFAIILAFLISILTSTRLHERRVGFNHPE